MKNQVNVIGVILLLWFLPSSAFAQRLALKAGLNLTTFADHPENENVIERLTTFGVRALAEYDFNEKAGIGFGLEATGKGAKFEESGAEYTIAPFYFQIPVNVFYRNKGFYAGFGPYLGLGMFGNYSRETSGQTTKDIIEFGNTLKDDLRTIDFGLGFEFGYHIVAPLRLSLAYEMGLINALPKDFQEIDDSSIKNRVLCIGLAWIFKEEL